MYNSNINNNDNNNDNNNNNNNNKSSAHTLIKSSIAAPVFFLFLTFLFNL